MYPYAYKMFKRMFNELSDTEIKIKTDEWIKTNWIKHTADNVYARTYYQMEGKGVFYDIFNKYSGIVVNEKKAANYDFLVKQVNNMVELKVRPEGTNTIKGLIDHEIGHEFDKKYNLSNNKEIQEIYWESLKNKEKFTKELSSYAWDNQNPNPYSEMIAEAWSEYCNNPNPRRIAQRIGRIIEELNKNEKNN